MPAQIRPTRLEVSDRFPMLGFNIRTDGPPQRAEIVLASEPGLFGADGKPRRTSSNFYSSRASGPVPVMRGEAMFVVPPEVLARFVGSEKIYFGLATAPEAGGAMQVAVKPTDASPYISLKGLTERSMRRVRILPNRQQRAAGYGKGGQSGLEWAGDVATPGMEPARANGGAAPAANGGAKRNGGAAPEPVPYDDGFGPMAPKAAAPASLAPAQSLGGRGRIAKALTIGPEDVEKAQRYAPNWADLFNWSAPAGVVSDIEGRGMSVQRIQDAAGELNLDRYEVEISAFPSGWDAPKLLEHFRTHINDFLDTRNTEFIPYDSSDETRWLSSSPLGTVFKLDIVGPDNAAVVVSAVEAQYFRVTTIHTEWSGDHPVSGHREFGYTTRGDKTVFYTRGADRATDGILETIVFAGADHLWKSFQSKLSGFVNDNGGSASAPTPFSERFHPKVVQILYGTAASLGRQLGLPRALDATPVAVTGPQQSVTAPSVRRLSTLEQTAITVGIAALPPPLGPLLAVLREGARVAGVSIGIGPAVGAGLGAGGTLGAGVVFGPDGGLGVYGTAEVDIGFISSISATVQITVVRGGIESFNGWSIAMAISGGEVVVGGAAALFDANSNFQGVSVSVGVGVGFSPVDFYIAVQRGVATQLGMAAALGQLPARGQAANGGGRKAVATAMVVGLEDRQKARKYARDFVDLFQWSPPASVVSGLTARGFNVQTLDAAVGDLNLDFYKVLIRRFPAGLDAPRLLQQFIRDINSFINTTYCEFFPYEDSDAQLLASSNPLGTALKIDMFGPDNAAVVISDVKPQFYAVTTINTPWSGDHPVSGHRQFGYFVVDGRTTFYTRGADRATLGFPGTETITFKGGEMLWKSFQDKLATFINENGGEAEILEPFSERFNAQAVREEFGHYDVTQSLGTARSMSADAFTVNWDDVELIPQPTNFSCWAAAGAMLVGWRDLVSLTPDTVAQVCSRSTASGLLTNDNAKFAAEMGFVAVPPVCYTEDGFRTLVENNGPLWVSEGVPPNLHAIVVTGMYSDGTNTYVRIADPWDRAVGTPGNPGVYATTHATGSRYIMSWGDFTQQYEAAMTGDPPNRQILHTGNPKRLTANTGQTTPPPGYAMSAYGKASNNRNGRAAAAKGRMPPPRARVRLMSDAAPVASIGGAPVDTVHGSQGNVSWDIDHFHGPKHPGNVAPEGGGAYSDAPTIRLDQWPVLRNDRGATSAWFTIDWLYDGRSIGDVRISNAGVSAGAGALVVRGQILDDSALYPPNGCASLKIRLTYGFQNGTEQIAVTEVRIYGDGTHEISSQWQQHALPAVAQSQSNGRLARAMDGGVSTVVGVVSTAIQLVGGQAITSPSWLQTKHPGDTAPPGVRQWKKQRKSLENVPWATGPVDKMTAYFDITWEYDGLSLRNIHFYPSVNSAILGDIQVSVDVIPREARRSNMYVPDSPMVAVVDLEFTYRFIHKIDDDETAVHRTTIYGDGGFWQNEEPEWIQGGYELTLAPNLHGRRRFGE